MPRADHRYLARLALAAAVGLLGTAAPAAGREGGAPAWRPGPELVVAQEAAGIWIGLDGDTLVAHAVLTRGGTLTRVFVRRGGVWSPTQELTPPAAAGSSSGHHVVLERDTLVVENTVYVRRQGRWVVQQQIPRGADGVPLEIVDLSGDLLVARPADNGAPAAAYVFVRRRAAWSQTARLTSGEPGDDFARAFEHSVAVSGQTIIVGARSARGGGAAHVFVLRDGRWQREQRLVAADRVGDGFGFAVALRGDTAVVRSNGRDYVVWSGRNLARVFERRGGVWSQRAKLRAPDHFFGGDLALDGDRLVLGTCGDGRQVSAYAGERGGRGWSALQKLAVASDASRESLARMRYGALALRGDTLAIAHVTNGTGIVSLFARAPR